MPRPDDHELRTQFAIHFGVESVLLVDEDQQSGQTRSEAERLDLILERVRQRLEQEFDYQFSDPEWAELTNSPQLQGAMKIAAQSAGGNPPPDETTLGGGQQILGCFLFIAFLVGMF